MNSRLLKILCIFFMIKPSLDLAYAFRLFTLGGKGISPLHLAGVFVTVYFGSLVLGKRINLPSIGFFIAFLIANAASIAITEMYTKSVDIVHVIDVLLRIGDAYVIYLAAGFAAKESSPSDFVKLVKAISIGTFLAVVLNAVGILLGFGRIKAGSNNSLRQTGLYHDAGVLAKIAMYNIIFTLFSFHLDLNQTRTRLFNMYAFVSIGLSIALILSSLSRSVIVLVPICIFIYLIYYHKGAGRIAMWVVVGSIVAGTAAVGLEDTQVAGRFSSEIMVFTDPGNIKTKTDKSVNFGVYERLGSNRGQLVAYMLDRFFKRDAINQVFGNFNISPAHSDYFDILSRNGYIGLSLYLALLLSVWNRAFSFARQMNDMRFRAMAASSLILITVHILLAFPFRPIMYTTTSWFMWSVLGFCFVMQDRLAAREFSLDQPRR